jgi:hypothetical protein
MSEELGRIQKPNVDEFKKGRKLFLIPLVFNYQGFPQEYENLCKKYWEQVNSQISGMENKLGSIKYIFHELVVENDENALKAVQAMHNGCDIVIKPRIDSGAKIVATEDQQVVAELMDWSRCLSFGLQTRKAIDTIQNFYYDALQKRKDFILKNLDETLKEDEICLFFMSEEQHIQFPQDIQVFYVAPPVLDELKRWMRDYQTRLERGEDAKEGQEDVQEHNTENESPANKQQTDESTDSEV